MLEIRPVCEHCGMRLSNGSAQAMICTFECTFCDSCVENLLHNVCPNCGGGFEKRPTRPKAKLAKHPVSTTEYVKPIDRDKFNPIRKKYVDIDPKKR